MNKFDQFHGMGDGNMGGIFSKLKKAVKKAVRGVRKVTSKIAKKVLPSSVRKLGRKLDKSGFNKIAAGAALAVFAGPAAIGAIKGSGVAAKAASLVGKAGSLIKAGAVAGAKAVPTLIKQTPKIIEAVGQVNQQIARSPEYQGAAQQYETEGMSQDEIMRQWANSQTAQMMAQQQAAQAVYPQVKEFVAGNYQSYGVPPDMVDEVAYAEAQKLGAQGVQEAKSNLTGLAIPALLAAFFFLK